MCCPYGGPAREGVRTGDDVVATSVPGGGSRMKRRWGLTRACRMAPLAAEPRPEGCEEGATSAAVVTGLAGMSASGDVPLLRICTPIRGAALPERMLSSGLLRSPPPRPPPVGAFLPTGRALMPTLGSETAGSAGKEPYGVCPTDGGGPWATPVLAMTCPKPGIGEELNRPGDDAKPKLPAGAEAGAKAEAVVAPKRPGLLLAAELKEKLANPGFEAGAEANEKVDGLAPNAPAPNAPVLEGANRLLVAAAELKGDSVFVPNGFG